MTEDLLRYLTRLANAAESEDPARWMAFKAGACDVLLDVVELITTLRADAEEAESFVEELLPETLSVERN